MTREAAINHLFDITMNPDYNIPICEKEAIEMAMEALKQEDILDKIRDEIEQIEINGHIRDVECFSAGIDTALKIIDKYNARKKCWKARYKE